jgi:hypothetical protein
LNAKFAAVVERLHPCFEQLMSLPPFTDGRLPKVMPSSGVYLFSEAGEHLYAGRSNNLRQRYGQHCNPGSQHNQAVFAFKLAREATGQLEPAYRPGATSRLGLSQSEIFIQSFVDAKARIRRMEYRYVEQQDQTLQALLELYCAIALGCRFNDCNTH